MFIYLYFELNLWSYDPASVEFLTLIGYVNNNQKQPRFYFYKLMYRIAAAVFPWWGLLSNLFILFGVMHRVRQNGKVMKVFSFWYAPCSQPIELHDSLKSNVLKTHWGRRLQGDQRPCNFWNTCGFFFYSLGILGIFRKIVIILGNFNFSISALSNSNQFTKNFVSWTNPYSQLEYKLVIGSGYF